MSYADAAKKGIMSPKSPIVPSWKVTMSKANVACNELLNWSKNEEFFDIVYDGEQKIGSMEWLYKDKNHRKPIPGEVALVNAINELQEEITKANKHGGRAHVVKELQQCIKIVEETQKQFLRTHFSYFRSIRLKDDLRFM
jgi:hypothetical protein